MSLLYECIHTCIVGGMIAPDHPHTTTNAATSTTTEDLSAITTLCLAKLKLFIQDRDQNLKYLGLYALGKLLVIRPSSVSSEYRDIVAACLDDEDISIRKRALDIICEMVKAKMKIV